MGHQLCISWGLYLEILLVHKHLHHRVPWQMRRTLVPPSQLMAHSYSLFFLVCTWSSLISHLPKPYDLETPTCRPRPNVYTMLVWTWMCEKVFLIDGSEARIHALNISKNEHRLGTHLIIICIFPNLYFKSFFSLSLEPEFNRIRVLLGCEEYMKWVEIEEFMEGHIQIRVDNIRKLGKEQQQ